MVRPELAPLLHQHVVKLDVWEEAVSAEDLAQYDRLLPIYLRDAADATAIVATGAMGRGVAAGSGTSSGGGGASAS